MDVSEFPTHIIELNTYLDAAISAAEVLGALVTKQKLECSYETRMALGISELIVWRHTAYPVDIVDMEYGYVRVTVRCEMSDTTVIRKFRLI